jgi:hypothetical protein
MDILHILSLIAAFLAAGVFLISRQIIHKTILPTLTENRSAEIITLIINKLSLLTFAAIILLFVGFIIDRLYRRFDQKPAPLPAPSLVSVQNVIFRGYVIDARTAKVITGAKITVKTQDKTLMDESDSHGAFVVRLQLPTNDLTVDLKVEANNYIPFSEHQVLATTSKSVSLSAAQAAESKQADTKKSPATKSEQLSEVVQADRNVSGIEITYRPSPSQWSKISDAYKNIQSPFPEVSYSMAAMSAERIRGYWVINFEPISVKLGTVKFAPVSTDQVQNQKFEDIIKAALIPLSIKWGDTAETTVDYSQSKFPSGIKISKDKIALTLRPPETMLSANVLKQNPAVTLRGEGDINDLVIRSLDPGVVLNQNLHINWTRETTAAAATPPMSHVAGPYPLKVDLTSAAAAVSVDESKLWYESSCPTAVCGGLICTPAPGLCMTCGTCGQVCCPKDENSKNVKVDGRSSFLILVLSLVFTFI